MLLTIALASRRAALLNALEIVGKDITKVKIVVNGAGASAISCTRIYVSLGAKKENIFMYDSKGLIHGDRTNLNGKKPEFINVFLFNISKISHTIIPSFLIVLIKN